MTAWGGWPVTRPYRGPLDSKRARSDPAPISVVVPRRRSGLAPGSSGWRSHVRRIEPLVVGALLTVIVFHAIQKSAGFWMPLDAAHFVAEADWIRGDRGVLPNIHPPVFPALVAASEWAIGRWTGVLLATSVSYALYVLAVYWLLRCWHAGAASWIGAFAAGAAPVLAEILGWGGGANLLGFAAVIAALAAAERWSSDGRWALGAGLLAGVAGATHPVAGVLAVVMSLAVAVPRDLSRVGWPRHVVHLTLFAAGGTPFALLARDYYTSSSSPPTTAFGWIDLSTTVELVGWAGREHPIIGAFQFAALVAPFVALGRHSRYVGLVLAVTIILVSSTLKGDPSYQSRVLYLLPALIGILVADLVPPAIKSAERWIEEQWSPWVGITSAAVVIGLLVQIGFLPRLDAASEYYSRVTGTDMRLLTQMAGRDGSIASSHWGDSTAEPTGWFVNAGARRPALSPMGPWLSTDPSEHRDGAAMQRFFAGQVGIERGDLQVAATGTDDGFYSLQVAVSHEGWYRPLFRLDSARSRFPFPVMAADAVLDGDAIRLTLFGPDDGRDRIDVRIEIESSGVDLLARPGASVRGSWHVVFSPAPGAWWSAEPRSSTTLDLELEASGRTLEGAVTAGADVPIRPTTYSAGQPIDFDLQDPTELTMSWNLIGVSASAGGITTFDELSIVEQNDIAEIVVWNNTGLVPRFADGCWLETHVGPSITAFERDPECTPDVR
jgi:hypothetical protein